MLCLTIQNLQYESLKERMDETRRARHDLRHHMTVLYSLCETGEYDQLASYLQNYLKQTCTDHPIVYCDNLTLNDLLVYYAQVVANRKFLSSKHEGYGIGLDSVLNIVKRYNGVLKTDTEGEMFCISVVLNL